MSGSNPSSDNGRHRNSINGSDGQPAWLLHARPWRETSQLLEVFTAEYGRLGLVAKGVRRPKSPLRGVLQPFQPLLISFSGRGELKTLRSAELQGVPQPLLGDAVMAGFYVNELLLKTLQREDSHPPLFAAYGDTLRLLRSGKVAWPLRRLEQALLGELGYAVETRFDTRGEILQPTLLYGYEAEHGATAQAKIGAQVHGRSLLALNSNDRPDSDVLLELKGLLQYLLQPLLEGKPMISSQIARQQARQTTGVMHKPTNG